MYRLGSALRRAAPAARAPLRAAARPCSTHTPLSTFTEDQEVLREAVRKFAEERIAPLSKEIDEGHTGMPAELIKDIFDQGFMGVEIDTDFGGSGMGFIDCLIVIEELARVDPGVAVMVDIHNTLINRCLDDYGTQAQKEKYLPKLATEMVSSFCISEPHSGSDAFALRTKAVEQPDGSFKINGSKCWISNAVDAGVFLVFATVDSSLGYKGITAFLVDAGTPGLSIGKMEDKLGIRASKTSTISFDDLVVPRDHVLGEVGKGYKIAIESLNEGRIGIACQMLGLAKGAYDMGLAYMRQREQFGTMVYENQGVKFQYAELATEIEAAHLLVYNAAALKEAGKPFIKEAAMAKLYCGQVAEKAASLNVEWHGGVGFTKEYGAEKLFRDCKIGSIYEGTSNIQKMTIARMVDREWDAK